MIKIHKHSMMQYFNFFLTSSFRKLLIFTTLSFFYILSNYAQTAEEEPVYFDPMPGDELFASPSVNAFQTYNFLPVNLYTGRIDLSIPLYEINVGKINIPIFLSYNSSGIKVDEISSSVGLGWSLNAGGNIVKIIKDLEDEERLTISYKVPNDIVTKTSYLGYHRVNFEIDETGSDNDDVIRYVDKVDGSPDIFRVNAPGLQTSFFLEDLPAIYQSTIFSTRKYHPVFLDNSGVEGGTMIRQSIPVDKLGFTGDEDGNPNRTLASYDGSNSILDFNNFELKNTNGLIYDFTSKDIYETYQTPIFLWWDFITKYNVELSTWHLNKITDPSTGEEVNFLYETYVKSTPDSKLSYSGTDANTGGFGFNDDFYIHTQYDGTGSSGYDFVHSNEVLTKFPRLQRLIEINWSGGKVEFNYAKERMDYEEDRVLTQIVVKDYNGKEIKQIDLEQNYFQSKENCSDYDCRRLKLNKVHFTNDKGERNSYEMEYNYLNPLPRRTSIQKDYLGYYNNNGETYTFRNHFEKGPSPQLWFYPNQGKYSILPFNCQNFTTKRIIPGYSLLPNTYSLTGLLNKITYPTGGYSEFDYENHQFKFFGDTYSAGGARIQSQRISDNDGNERLINYIYEEADGTTSGYVNNIPVYGYPNTNALDLNASSTQWSKYFTTFDKFRSGIELTDGGYVGYSRVIEREIGLGKTIFEYTSPKFFPNIDVSISTLGFGNLNYLIDNSAYPGYNPIDRDLKRGKLFKKTIFTETGTELKKIENQYLDHKVFKTVDLYYGGRLVNDLYAQGGPGENSTVYMGTSQLFIERNPISKKIEIDKTPLGDVQLTKEYAYDPDYPFVTEVNESTSDGQNIMTRYEYLQDNNWSMEPEINKMFDENRRSEIIGMSKFKDSQKLFEKRKNYATTSGLTLPSSNLESKEDNVLSENSNFLYSDRGKIIQFQKTDGAITVIIWGYQGQFPIARIQSNLTYSEIDLKFDQEWDKNLSFLEDLSNNDIDLGSEETLRFWQQKLREALEDFNSSIFLTTYTYDPLVGLTSVTDPRGYTSYYGYDGFNRLESVRDGDGNLIQEHDYHYRSGQ